MRTLALSQQDLLNQAYLRGKRDWRASLTLSQNPYPKIEGSQSFTPHASWVRGWLAASMARSPSLAELDRNYRSVMARRPRRNRSYDWSQVDWTRQDVLIAKQLGCPQSSVRQHRKKFGHPRSPRHFQKTLIQFCSAQEKARSWDWTKSAIQLAKEHGISRQRVYVLRRKVFAKLAEP